MPDPSADPARPQTTGPAPADRPAPRPLGDSAFAFLDQALYAAGNFAVQLLLARQLPEADYGTFATGYALLILLGTLHTAFLTEPMMVFGSRRYHHRLPNYLHSLIRSHLKLTLAFATTLLAGAALAYTNHQAALAETLAAFALAQPLILLPWMLRSAAYIQPNPRVAAIASTLYTAALLLGLAVLLHTGTLRIGPAIAVMAGASALAAAFLLPALRIPLKRPTHPNRFHPARARHRRYGLWAAPTNIVRFLPEHLPFLLLPALLSYADNGGYKAMNNLTIPFFLLTAALSTLALPRLVQARHTGHARRLLTRYTLAAALPPLLAWPLVAGLAPLYLPALYAGNFLDDTALLWVLGLIPVTAACHTLLHAAFKAAEQPRRILPAAALACIVLLALPWPLTHTIGLTGMALAVLAAHLTHTAAALVLLRQLQPRSPSAGP